MGKNGNLIILTIAIIWGRIKEELFNNTNYLFELFSSILVLMSLWILLELTNNNGVENYERK